jgi:hypothetical protein
VFDGVLNTTYGAEAVRVNANPQSSLMSIDSAGKKLDEETAISGVSFLVKPLQGSGMHSGGPLASGLEMSEPLGFPDVVEEVL